MATAEVENEAADGAEKPAVRAGGKAVATPVQSVTQGEATAPPSVDAQGNQLDEYGLPLAGPLRFARLAQLGHDDPRAVDGWGLPPAEPYRAAKLAALGRREPATHPEDWS